VVVFGIESSLSRPATVIVEASFPHRELPGSVKAIRSSMLGINVGESSKSDWVISQKVPAEGEEAIVTPKPSASMV
jgi:hypothetical protein